MECCDHAGGLVTLDINGRRTKVRAVASVQPTTREIEAASNMDGTIYTTVKPVPAQAEITLSDHCGLRLADVMGCHIDVTIRFEQLRRTYLFTQATVIGRPSVNPENGEISGLTVVSQNVQEIEG